MKGDEVAFKEKISVRDGVVTWSRKNFSFKDGVLYYKSDPLNQVVSDYVYELLEAGHTAEPILKFIENLYLNPSKRAVDELYNFLAHKNMPITPDGCFLAYKAITVDWKDKWTKTICNKIGARPKMPRHKVSDDVKNDCHYGLHAGSVTYASVYRKENDRMVIVKINPKHVVCIPEADSNKLRCCEYKVLEEFTQPLSNGLSQ